MNGVTLERLIKNRVDAVNKADIELEKLEHFCEKNWGINTGQTDDLQTDDRIAESIHYGHYTISVDEFCKIMDKAKNTVEVSGQ